MLFLGKNASSSERQNVPKLFFYDYISWHLLSREYKEQHSRQYAYTETCLDCMFIFKYSTILG